MKNLAIVGDYVYAEFSSPTAVFQYSVEVTTGISIAAAPAVPLSWALLASNTRSLSGMHLIDQEMDQYFNNSPPVEQRSYMVDSPGQYLYYRLFFRRASTLADDDVLHFGMPPEITSITYCSVGAAPTIPAPGKGKGRGGAGAAPAKTAPGGKKKGRAPTISAPKKGPLYFRRLSDADEELALPGAVQGLSVQSVLKGLGELTVQSVLRVQSALRGLMGYSEREQGELRSRYGQRWEALTLDVTPSGMCISKSLLYCFCINACIYLIYKFSR